MKRERRCIMFVGILLNLAFLVGCSETGTTEGELVDRFAKTPVCVNELIEVKVTTISGEVYEGISDFDTTTGHLLRVMGRMRNYIAVHHPSATIDVRFRDIEKIKFFWGDEAKDYKYSRSNAGYVIICKTNGKTIEGAYYPMSIDRNKLSLTDADNNEIVIPDSEIKEIELFN